MRTSPNRSRALFLALVALLLFNPLLPPRGGLAPARAQGPGADAAATGLMPPPRPAAARAAMRTSSAPSVLPAAEADTLPAAAVREARAPAHDAPAGTLALAWDLGAEPLAAPAAARGPVPAASPDDLAADAFVFIRDDPIEPPVTLPLTASLTAGPAAVVTPGSLDYGQVFAGYTHTLELLVENAGTEDLVVSSIVANDPALSASPSSFVVPPLAAGQLVTVTYAPPASATLSAELAITSNDPVTPLWAVGVTGTAVEPPALAVAPATIEHTIDSGLTRTVPLTLSNLGGSDLAWTASAVPYPSSLQTAHAVEVVTLPAPGVLDVPPQDGLAAAFHLRPDAQVTIRRPVRVMAAGPRVLLVQSDYDTGSGSPIQGFLQAYGDLAAVDLYDAYSGTPTLAELQAYDVVVTWSNVGYADPGALGDVLAGYVDAGGRVIVAMFALGGVPLQGRFMSEDYTPLKGSDYIASTSCLGTYDAQHPIMRGVTDVCDYWRLTGSYLTPDSTAVARWQDGRIFVAVKDRLPVIGLGAYVGHFYDWTGQMPDVLHNAILYLIGHWLQVTPGAGTVPAHASVPVTATLDAADLVSGTYLAGILIDSNDPVTPRITVPVTMHVTADPAAAVTPSALDFGQVPPGDSYTLQILVENEGMAGLVVSGIAATHPDLSVSPSTFVVPPLSTGQPVTVTYAPAVSGTLSASVVITTNDPLTPVWTVGVTGAAVDPPVISVTPPEIDEVVPAGDTAACAVTITNRGGGELLWTISGSGGSDYTLRTSDEPGGPSFDWVDITTSGTLVPGLSDDGYAGPFDLGFDFNFYGLPQTQFYIASNGFLSFGAASGSLSNQCPLPDATTPNNLIALMWDDLYPNYATGGVYRQTFSTCPTGAGPCTVVEFHNWNHYAGSAGSAGTFEAILFANGTILLQFLDAGTESGSGSTTGIEGPDPAAGQGATLGCNQSGTLADGLAASFSALPSWLAIDPVSGAVPAGDSAPLTVTLDAAGLVSSTYHTELRIDSSDPFTPQVTLPVTMRVTADPSALVTPAQLDFGTVFAGYTHTLQLLVENEGLADLVVSGIAAGDPALSVSPSSFVVPALAAGQAVTVFFAPTAAGSLSATLVLTSNDPITPVWTVDVSGTAVEPPAVAVAPAAVEQTIDSGTTRAVSLTLTNTGGSDLLWQASTAPSPSAWLAVAPAAGTLPAGASVPITATVDAAGLISGTYTAAVVIDSNDPVAPQVTVPVTVHVLGQPAAAVTPAQLDFGTLFPGYTRTLQIRVENDGMADLVVSGIAAGDPALSASPSSFVLPALGSGQDVDVTYAPVASGTLSATLVVTTNDPVTPVWTIAVVGAAVEPPVLVITPPAIDEAVPAGLARAATLTITNRGGSDLAWQAPTRVLLVHADGDSDYGSPMQAFLQAYGDLTAVDLYDARTSTPSLAELQAYDVVVTWSNWSYANATAMGDVLAGYVDAGGRVIVAVFALSGGLQGRLVSANYVPVKGTGTATGTSCLGAHDPDHPIFQGVTNVCGYYRLGGSYLTPDATAVAHWQDGNIFVAVKDQMPVVGLGAYIGYDYRWTGQMADVVHNSILYLTDAWLSVTPVAGTVPGAASMPITVTLDAAGLVSGTYHAGIRIESNDPLTPQVTIPVTMQVGGDPAAAITPAQLDFGTVFVGYTHTQQLLVANEGLADLVVSGIAASDPALSASPSSFVVPVLTPGQVVTVTYAPVASGTLSAALTITTNDPLTPVWTVDVRGTALEPPAIAVAPAAIDETLESGTVQTVPLTVTNGGGSDLLWSVSTLPYPAALLSVTPDAGTVPAHTSVPVTVTLDATGLVSGTYATGLAIDSNDPVTPRVGVSITVHVTGQPSAAVTPALLDYGTVFAGYTHTLQILVQNEGMAGLVVVDITASDPALSVSPSSFLVPPLGSGQAVTVTYAPAATGTLSATLTITTDDPVTPVWTIPVTGRAVDPPIISVTPQAIESTLEAGTAGTVAITIGNAGASDLVWAVPGSAGGEYTLRTSHEPGGPAFEWVDITASGTLIPGLTDDSYAGPFDLGFAFDFYGVDHTQFYVSSNGFLSFGAGSPARVNQCPLPDATAPDNLIALMWDDLIPNYATGGLYRQVFGDCPLRAGPCTVVEFHNWSHFEGAAASAGTFEAILFPDGTILLQFLDAGLEAGSGATTGIEGPDPAAGQGLELGCNQAGTLAGGLAVSFSALPFWLGVDPAGATVPAGDTASLTVTLDAAGLISSTYYAELPVDSNDPVTPHVAIPVALHVTGDPAAAVDPALDFGDVFATYPHTLPLTIENRGTDRLVVDIASDNPVVSALPTHLIVPALQQQVVDVIATPQVVGAFSATLTLTTTDPISPVWTVDVQGTAIHTPAIRVDPAAFDVVIDTGQVTSRTLLVHNDAAGTLTWTLDAVGDLVALDPVTGTLAGPGQLPVAVTFDATTLPAAEHHDRIEIASNDPAHPFLSVPVTLTVILVPPEAPVNPAPQDGEINVRVDRTLTWLASPHAVTYSVYLWQDGTPKPPAPTASGLIWSSYDPPANLPTNTTFHWQAVATNAAGDTPGPEWTFTTETLPDLVVASVTVPPSAYSGQPVELSWMVTNIGDRGTTVLTWPDLVYLSLSPVFEPNLATYLGRATNPSYLGPGESYVKTATFNIPQGLSGNYYAFVRTDGDAYSNMREIDETNNTGRSASTIDVEIPPLPDLQVTTLSGPAAAFSGQPVAVTWSVRNQGPGTTSVSSWSDRVYLAFTTTLDVDQAYLLRTVTHSGALASGEGYTPSIEVNLPQAIYGPHYLFVTTDIYDDVYENVWEKNNTSGPSDPVAVTLSPPPDLEVTAVTAPAAADSATDLNVAWTVANNGAGEPFESYWYDRIYLSPSPALTTTTGALVLGTFYRTGALAPGDAYSRAEDLALPVDISGTQYLHIWTDYDNRVFEYLSDDNNVAHQAISITLRPPDLVVPDLQAPAQAMSGDTIPVSWHVANDGPGQTFETFWRDRVYLSPGAVLDPASAILLGTFDHSGRLLAGGEYGQARDLALPEGLAGLHYVHVWTDYDNRVFEHNADGNNVATHPISITLSPSPDLQVAVVSSDPTGAAGTPFDLLWAVRNDGSAPADPAWQDRAYLSTDTAWDPGDLVLGTYAHLYPLAPGGVYTESRTVVLPDALPAGTYHVLMVADQGDDVYEHGGEENNLGASAPVSISARPSTDLQLTAVSAPPAGASGAPVSIQWVVSNAGTIATQATSWTDVAYLSADTTLDPATDLLVDTWLRSGALAAGQAYTRTEQAALPHGIEGEFTLFLLVDSQGRVDDGDRSNNAGYATPPVSITLSLSPDLQPAAVSAPGAALSGQPVTVQWMVDNQGAAAAAATWYDAVYLSADPLPDASDTQLVSRRHTTGLAPGGRYTETVQAVIPAWATGAYYLVLQVDSRDDVYEHLAEENNVIASPVNVTVPPPADLVVESVTVPTTAVPGGPLTVEWTVRNQGDFAATGYLCDAVYVSPDTTWDVSDAFVADWCGSIDLGPGEVRGLQVEAVLPDYGVLANLTGDLPGVTPGAYHGLVRTDVLNHIRESDDGNNTGASAGTIAVDVPALALDVPATGLLGTGDSHYYRVDVPAGETLIVTLDGSAATASNELYVRYGQVPGRGSFDFRYANPFEEDQEVVVPLTRDGTYYVLVYGADVPGGPAGYSIVARVPAFSVLHVSPASVGNAGPSTLEIQGARFALGTAFQAVSPGGQVLDAHDVLVRDAGTAFATFDFSGQAPGLYDLRAVRDGGLVATLEDAFSVTPGSGARFEVQITGPSSVRIYRNYVFYVDVGNSGDADLVSPMLTLYSPTGTPVGFSPDALAEGESLRFLATSDGGPAGTLRPGEHRRFPVYFYTASSSAAFEVYAVQSDDTRLINWPEVESLDRPDSIPEDEWPAIWAAIQARVGDTWGDYVSTLAAVATRLYARGESAFEVRDLFEQLAMQESGDGYSLIAGLLISLDSGQLVDGAQVVARYEQDADTTLLASDVTGDAGAFRLDGLSPGGYDLYVDGYYFDDTPTFTVTRDTDVTGAVLYAHPVPPEEPEEPVPYEVSDSQPSLAVDDGGDLHMVWQRDEEVWQSTYSGGAWGHTTPVTGAHGTAPGVTFDPALVGGQDPGLAVVWQSGFGNEATLHYAVGEAGAGGIYTWSLPVTLTSDAYGDTQPVLVATDDGQLLVLWLQQDWGIQDDQDLYYAVVDMASIPLVWAPPPDAESSTSEADAAVQGMYCDAIQFKKWTNVPLPIVGGAYGISANAQLCGDANCSGITIVGSLTAKAKLSERIEGNGGGTAKASWKMDRDSCSYVFNSAQATLSAGATGTIPAWKLPVAWPEIEIGSKISGQVGGNLVWKAGNFPGWPSDGYVSLQVGLGPYGKVVFLKDSIEASVEGIGSIMGSWRPPSSFRIECASLAVQAQAKAWIVSTSWSKVWKAGPCASAAQGTLLDALAPPPAGALVIRDASQQDGVLSESEAIIVVEPYTGTGSIYEGTPVLSATIGTDLRHDGAPAVARSGGEVLAAWTKDSADWHAATGSALVVARYAGTAWQAPVEIQPADHFNREPAILFAGEAPVVLWPSAPATVTLTSPVTEVLAAIERTDILFSYRDGDTWTPPAPVAELPGEDTTVRAAAGAGGQLYAAWLNTAGGHDTLYSAAWDGSSWSPASTIPVTSPVQSLDLAVTGGGTPLLVWTQEYTSTQTGENVQSLYYATWDGSAWSPAARFAKPDIQLLTGFGGPSLPAAWDTPQSLAPAPPCAAPTTGVATAPAVSFDAAAEASAPGAASQSSALIWTAAGSAPDGLDTPAAPGTVAQAIPTSTPQPPGDAVDQIVPAAAPGADPDGAQPAIPVSTPQPPGAVGATTLGGQLNGAVPPEDCCSTDTPTPTPTPSTTPSSTPTPDPTTTPTPPPPATYVPPVVVPVDPNDILGPEGYGDARWMPVDSTFDYTIRCENDPDFASAPAQRVLITQTLDADLDARTFRLGAFGFGDHVFAVPEERSFYSARLGPFPITTTLPTTQTFNLYVDVHAGIDLVSGQAFWILQSIDPATGAPPLDAGTGFLPPNTAAGEGEAFVSYRVSPGAAAQTGDVVDAWARIVFDDSDPLDTPAIWNTIDAVAPTSAVDPLPPETVGTEVLLAWTSSDDPSASGVRDVDLYVSTDGGPFALSRVGLAGSAAVFSAEPGHTYGFFTVATDHAGNREPRKTAAEAQTLLYLANTAAALDVVASPSLLAADGASTSVLSATVRDATGALLPGQTVDLTSTLGTLSAVTATTGVSGTVAVTLTAGFTPGTTVVTASLDTVLGALVATTPITLEAPVAGLAARSDSPTELGQPTALTATVTAGTHVTYTWDLGDGEIRTGATVTHTYPAVGLWTALVTATNPVGAITATAPVTITDVPVLALSAANDSPTPLGGATALTATVQAGSNVTYTWLFGDGSPPLGAAPGVTRTLVVTHAYPAPGRYTAVVTAANSANRLAATTPVTVDEVISGLSASNDSPTPLGSATALTATVAAGSHVSYTWDLGDGATATGAIVSHTYPAVGLYTAVVTATNSVSQITATAAIRVDEAIAGLWAANDSPTALGEATALTATVAAGSHVSYTWAFGDGALAYGRAVTHTYPAAGLYPAVVTATNSVSRITATTSVAVEQAIAGLAAINDSPAPLGSSTALTATVAAGTHVTYSWAFGDGTTGSGSSLTHVYPNVGVYTAVVTAANPVSQLEATTPVTITDIPIAALAAANDSPTPLGQATALTATVAAGSNVTYAWAFGDGTHGSGPAVTHTYAVPGLYTAVVTAANSTNLLTATTAVTVQEAIAGLVATNDSPTQLGAPTALTATVTAGSGVTYTWQLGDGQVAAGAQVQHIYSALGLYTAAVTASNALGTFTATTAVTITDVPVAGLVATNDSPTTLGEATTLTATVGAGTHVAYSWDLGDGVLATGPVTVHVYPAPGLYTAVVTAANPMGALVATTTVTVTDVPVSGLAATNDSPTELGGTTTLSATVSSGTNVTFTWAFGDGSAGTGPIVAHLYPAVGLYTAVVTASNSAGAVTATTPVTVTDVPVSGLAAANDSPTPLGAVTILTATVAAGSNVTYTWDLGDGEFAAGPVVAHVFPEVGFYTSLVTASNSVGSLTATTTVTIAEVPVAGLAATSDSPTALGTTTTLTATVDAGSHVVYAWDFGDGERGQGAVAAHTYAAAGVYTAAVTATNPVSVMTATTTVVVQEAIAGLAAANDGPTPLGAVTGLTATIAAGEHVTYTWLLGDGAVAAGPVVSHTYAVAGTYAAVVTARNLVSRRTATTTVRVEQPVAGLVARSDGPTPLGRATALTATVTAGSHLTYTWAFGDGAFDLGPVVTHTYPATGTYTAVVTAFNHISELAATATVTITLPDAYRIYLPLVLRRFPREAP